MRKVKKTKRQRQVAQAHRQQALARRRVNETQTPAASQQQERAALQLQGLLEDSVRDYAIGLFEKFDGMAGLRNGLRKIAADREEWAGLPMILEDHPLTIEKTHPYAERLMGSGATIAAEEDEMNGVLPVPKAQVKIRNVFYSWRYRSNVVVYEEGGKIQWGPTEYGNSMGMQLDTLGASDAWGIEQESNAVKLLGTMVRHRQFKQYLMTGMFLEKSERSGVHYLFRRLRPTVAMSGASGMMKALCALCLHPIGYYTGTWAGAMCPTDEVVAHLMLMRGDEPMFWRRSNQHAPFQRQAWI